MKKNAKKAIELLLLILIPGLCFMFLVERILSWILTGNPLGILLLLVTPTIWIFVLVDFIKKM